ncbi:MAG: acetylglutamate kinase, partial [Myxococcota bacterium]|nr:acetylglutamate kinase [Myxococcota bacterium]
MSEEFSPPDDRIEPLQDRAATIVEALPYIQRFAGECVVVKFGGHAMANEAVQRSFARDVTLMRSIGVQVIVVHGGGPEIKKSLERFGIESTFRSGMRVTSDEVMEVVQMELLGRVNPRLVSLIQQSGGRAVGLSGIDGRLLLAERLLVDGESIGRVGQVRRVDDSELQLLGKGGFIPVIAPVGVDESGVSMNINADLAASAIASHMLARKLILMTDVPG